MKASVLAASAAAAFAASSLLGYAFATSDTPTVSVAADPARAGLWYGQVQDCVSGPVGDAQDDCLYQVMTDAIDARDLVNLNAGLARKVQEDPHFYGLCHGAGHKAGQYAYRNGHGVEEVLDQLADPVCQYGIGHGVIDGMADSQPGIEDFRELAQTCHKYWNGDDAPPDPAYVFCLDGSGHGSYWHTRDPIAAAQLCDLHLTSQAKQECMGGVMMEMYEPAGFIDRGPADYQLEQAARDLPRVCQDIAQLSIPDLARGCAKGAGYVLTRPSWALIAEDPDRMTETELLAVAREWARNADACLLLGQLAEDCQGMAEYQMPWPLRQSGLQKQACQMLKDQERLDPCTGTRVSIT